jgi:palmitoyl-protein thioesterase
MSYFRVLIFLLTILLSLSVSAQKPIVILHGLESNAGNLNELAQWITDNFNRTVYNIELGNGDEFSIETPIYKQIDEFKLTIQNISELNKGFDFIGISQGGLIGRGYVQKYNHESFKVDNLITLVTPHGGVFDKYLSFIGFYTKNMQEKLSFSNYWRDPIKYDKYKLLSTFLANANNEVSIKNLLYRDNIINLKNFVMVYSPIDEIIKPPETGIFSMYDKNLNIITLFDSDIFIQDWLGLKVLYDSNRLYMFNTNCTHVEHRMPICFPQLYNILSKFI